MVSGRPNPAFYSSAPKGPRGKNIDSDDNFDEGDGDFITQDIEVSLGGLIRLAFAIFGVAQAAGESQVELTRQRALSEGRPTLLTLSDLQEALRRDLVTDEQYKAVLARYGYTDKVIEDLSELAHRILTDGEVFEAYRRNQISETSFINRLEKGGLKEEDAKIAETLTHTLVGAGELLELFRRNEISEQEYTNEMRRLGYQSEEIEKIKELRFFVPPVQDVIRFLVRDIYDPTLREKLNLDDKFPENSLEPFSKVGVNDPLARDYWAAHWDLPSIQLGFQMLHRTDETNITKEDLELLFQAKDIMPYWRDAITAVSYKVPSRVDVRRLYRVGVIDEEQVYKNYLRLGYAEEDAKGLTEFTVQEYAPESTIDDNPFTNRLRNAATGLYLKGDITEEELGSVFAGLGLSEEAAQLFVDDAEFQRTAKLADAIRDKTRDLYINGYWTKERTIEELAKAGFTGNAISRQFQIWDLERNYKLEREEDKNERELTKTDTLGAYRDKIIDRPIALQLLETLGYEAEEAEVLIDRIDYKELQEFRKREESAIHDLYLAGVISRSTALQDLDKITESPRRRDSLLSVWDAEKRARTPTLSVSQVQRSLKNGIIDETDARIRFIAKGYNEADTEILIALSAGTEQGGAE